MKQILAGFATLIVLLIFFFFYEASIFEAEIVESTGTYHKDISFRALFFNSSLPDFVNQDQLESITPTAKTWLLTIAIFIGLPIMIGLRTGVRKTKN